MKQHEYFCTTPKNGRLLSGYRTALSADLALSCFVQDVGAEETSARSKAIPVTKILLSRLREYLPTDIDPWSCEGSFNIDEVQALSWSEVQDMRPSVRLPYERFLSKGKHIGQGVWHEARIRWLMERPKHLAFPLEIDNLCGEGSVYPVPVLLDGWHRYFASCLLNLKTVYISYGGRTDLLDYLAGKRKNPPEY